MRSAIARALALLPLILSGTACSYLRDRSADFLDVFTLEAGFGAGAHAGVKLTDLTSTGVGYNRQHAAALHGRYAGIVERLSLGLVITSMTRVSHKSAHMTDIVGDTTYVHDPALATDPVFTAGDPAWNWLPWPGMITYFHSDTMCSQSERLQHRPHRVLDVHAELSLGVALHVGVSPGEFVDFLLGWFTIDLAGDDTQSTSDAAPDQRNDRKARAEP